MKTIHLVLLFSKGNNMATCLIADDSKVIRLLMSKIMNNLGFSVIEAEDGEDVVELAQTQTPDLIIMDWNTNKDLYKNFKGQKLLSPFDELLDMPLNLYKLQLSLYQSCINKVGLKVVARRILWLKPDGSYDKINLEEYVNMLREALKTVELKPLNHE